VNRACLQFGHQVISAADIAGRRVIEVGALNINGSLRPHVESLGPASYLGVDITAGPGVDEVCDAEQVVARFGFEVFDVVISTEMLEHVRDWRTVVRSLKGLVRPGGLLVTTTRSLGFPYHGFPYDFWRYELDDMKRIFADFRLDDLRPDPSEPGVFLRAVKPVPFREVGLNEIALFSMVRRRRIAEFNPRTLAASPRIRLAAVTKRLGLTRWVPGGVKRSVLRWMFG
jgi:SAM-dependent methyltransferase